MACDYLKVYLNDHLAGAAAALALLAQLEEAHSGTALQGSLTQVRTEIEKDRDELKKLMSRLQVPESRPRQAMAWISEKFAELKLRIDDRSKGALRLLEALEALALGIEGKRALWGSLRTVAETVPLGDIDLGRLERRAEEQRSQVEALRLQAAKAALSG
jgi:hypothetical protein